MADQDLDDGWFSLSRSRRHRQTDAHPLHAGTDEIRARKLGWRLTLPPGGTKQLFIDIECRDRRTDSRVACRSGRFGESGAQDGGQTPPASAGL